MASVLSPEQIANVTFQSSEQKTALILNMKIECRMKNKIFPLKTNLDNKSTELTELDFDA